MSKRTLLVTALVLMAGGLLLGGLGAVLGGVPTPFQSEQVLGPSGQQGPAGGIPRRHPIMGPETERGEGSWMVVPSPKPSPKP